METIQVTLEQALLRAADRAAKRVRISRSALVREALRVYLRSLRIHELEHRDRRGYQAQRDSPVDFGAWERVEVWPEE